MLSDTLLSQAREQRQRKLLQGYVDKLRSPVVKTFENEDSRIEKRMLAFKLNAGKMGKDLNTRSLHQSRIRVTAGPYQQSCTQVCM